MLKVKSGVTPRNLVIAAAVANTAQILGLELTITSGTDGKHKRGSKHYSGEALDVRTRNLTKANVKRVVDMLAARLGRGYDVVLETDHIHVEYDPK
jgi:hypothetical protein